MLRRIVFTCMHSYVQQLAIDLVSSSRPGCASCLSDMSSRVPPDTTQFPSPHPYGLKPWYDVGPKVQAGPGYPDIHGTRAEGPVMANRHTPWCMQGRCAPS